MTSQTHHPAPYTYSSRIVDADGFGPDLKLRKLHKGEIVRSDGVVVWRTDLWASARSVRGPLNVSLGRIRAYLKQHGRCWYDDQQAQRAADKAEKDRRAAIIDAVRFAARAGAKAALDGQPCDPPAELSRDLAAIWRHAHAHAAAA